jgi:hypothetical protein
MTVLRVAAPCSPALTDRDFTGAFLPMPWLTIGQQPPLKLTTRRNSPKDILFSTSSRAFHSRQRSVHDRTAGYNTDCKPYQLMQHHERTTDIIYMTRLLASVRSALSSSSTVPPLLPITPTKGGFPLRRLKYWGERDETQGVRYEWSVLLTPPAEVDGRLFQ